MEERRRGGNRKGGNEGGQERGGRGGRSHGAGGDVQIARRRKGAESKRWRAKGIGKVQKHKGEDQKGAGRGAGQAGGAGEGGENAQDLPIRRAGPENDVARAGAVVPGQRRGGAAGVGLMSCEEDDTTG